MTGSHVCRCENHGAAALGFWRAVLAVAAGSCALSLWGCESSASASRDAPAGAASAAQPVHVANVEQREVPLALRAIGTVEALASVTIRSQVAGRLTKVDFDDGQEVQAGDVLFEIDPRPAQAALALSRANLTRDKAMALDAEREAKRVAGLFSNDNASDRERDEARADADAKAAQVQADEAMMEQAELDLEYCTIRAPLTGRVGARLVDPGDIVKDNDTALVVVNQIDPIYVSFSVAERHLSEIRRYAATGALTVEARYPQGDETVEHGTLTFTDNEVDRSTGMIRLKGTFANASGRMWPGQFVNVSLVLTTRPQAIVTPTKAIQAGPEGQFVYVVDAKQTVEMRPVRIADALDGLTVVESGVAPGERVVTDGQLRLVPGAEVKVLADESASASQPADGASNATNGGA